MATNVIITVFILTILLADLGQLQNIWLIIKNFLTSSVTDGNKVGKGGDASRTLVFLFY